MPVMLFCLLRLSARGSQDTCFICPIMGPLIGDFRQQARLLAKTFGLCGLSQTLQLKSVGGSARPCSLLGLRFLPCTVRGGTQWPSYGGWAAVASDEGCEAMEFS